MVSIQKKKVVILGAGAVGLLYGSRLLEAEQNKGSLIDVHFICRRDFDYIKTNGFHMKSPDGDYATSNLSMNKKIHCDSSTIDVPPTGVDWIIICVKCYSFQGDDGVLLKAMIETMVGSNTRFLLIMNGLGCEKHLCDWFGAEKLFVGMAFTCVNRNNPKNKIDTDIPFILVDHIAFGALQIAHCQDNPVELEIAKSLWIDTKIEEKVTTGLSLLYAQWSKLCWNIPFSGLCVALGGIIIICIYIFVFIEVFKH
jgi:2-dehydropantoate 2-reductase